jgi:hypothetical protein
MPFGSVKLIPGVNVERTPTLLEAGVSQSQLIRYRDGLVQKYGGWQKFYGFSVAGVPRELHAWEDLNSVAHLEVATTTQLDVITNNSLINITPQQLTTNPAPSFTTTIGSPTVTVTDPGIANVTSFDAVYFNTPISVDGIILSGIYQIVEPSGVDSYTITAATNGVAGVTNGGAVPVFTTASGSAQVKVTLDAHGLVAGNDVVFPIATTGNGLTIQPGSYTVVSIVDSNNFNIIANNQASGSGSFSMNGGNAQLVYYIAIGPTAVGAGYGLGGYGTGGYGTGTSGSSQTGTPITATDWTSDNWGEILLSCPAGGGVYQYNPTGGFSTSQLVETAPTFNGGIFVSMQQQILVCWGASQAQNIGIEQNPLLVAWSTIGDYTNFVPLATDDAGSFVIPTGSKIMGGMSVANNDLIWTDLDLWAMNFQGPPFVFGFNKIGAGAGLISSHAAMPLRGNVYWMGPSNFYSLTGNGVAVIPCPVWDFVFQNLNTGISPATGLPYVYNVRAMPNTPFNEAGFEFPSAASANGENDSYVKFNIAEPGGPWDYGSLPRSAWIDQTILGPPIGTVPTGIIYQHETTNDADGQPLVASFTTGYFFIAEGEDFAIVDQILPDFKWGFFGSPQTAQIQLTFNIVNFPGDTPVAYGPYTVTQAIEILTVRFRGRQMSVTVASADTGSFWRLGRIRYRFASSGRR